MSELIPLLNDVDSGIRSSVIRTLGLMGKPSAELTVPHLIPLLKDPHQMVQSAKSTIFHLVI